MLNIAIIGAGAAGCFAAIRAKQLRPDATVTLYEAQSRPLAKVGITGGGRCNLTNSFRDVRSLERVYPRGHRLMKRLLRRFSHADTMAWFEQRGVQLVTQADQCVFPRSQNAQEIVATLLQALRDCGVSLRTLHRIDRIAPAPDGRFTLTFRSASQAAATFDRVLVTTGGSPTASGLHMLAPLGLSLEPPVPSLFSLTLPDDPIRQLMGTVVSEATASIPGTRFSASGPLLITHWGLSGPAILKLSSYAARHLAEADYQVPLAVNWLGEASEETARTLLQQLAAEHPQKLLASAHPDMLYARLWAHLLGVAGLRPDLRWAELGSKGMNRLVATLTHHTFRTGGKNRYKDEFVTCGGVALSNVGPSLQSSAHPGLFFAGEVLDIDAITGGFNLQAAWTTGYVAAEEIILES